MRTGLNRPGNACYRVAGFGLICSACEVEDVARDAGDVSARFELDLVRPVGNALIAHVEGYVLRKIDARPLRCGVGILEGCPSDRP